MMLVWNYEYMSWVMLPPFWRDECRDSIILVDDVIVSFQFGFMTSEPVAEWTDITVWFMGIHLYYLARLNDAFGLALGYDHLGCLFAKVKRQFLLTYALIGISKDIQRLRDRIDFNCPF